MEDARVIATTFLTFEVSGRTLQVYGWHVLEFVMAGRQAAAAGAGEKHVSLCELKLNRLQYERLAVSVMYQCDHDEGRSVK